MLSVGAVAGSLADAGDAQSDGANGSSRRGCGSSQSAAISVEQGMAEGMTYAVKTSLKDWRLRVAGAAFLFWAAYLVSLDPGSLVRGIGADARAPIGEEVMRITGASLLGSIAALLQFPLVGRFPVVGQWRLANLAIQLSACLGLSLVMIVVAAFLAPLVMGPGNPRLAEPLEHQLAANVLLVAFGLWAFALVLHLALKRETTALAVAPAPSATRIPVQNRDGVMLVEVEAIDWIESQGNYAALHAGSDTHLVRETLTRLSQRLDPERFVRIHRGAIVNVVRLKRMKALASGDALVELADGTELRASRTFAGGLREVFGRTG
jgi:hypothetical protein